MSGSNVIILDEKSGISIEEQKEILSAIDGITEKNRRSLSDGIQTSEKRKINAKKSGVIFPAAVNIAAVIVLCTGAFILIYINTIKDVQIRTGAAGYDLVLAGVQHETSEELVLARRELELLTTERERIDRIDLQISAGLIEISNLIRANEFDFAKERVQHWQSYLSIDFIASSSAFLSRKENYEELLKFTDDLIEDAKRQYDLIILTAENEQAIAENERTITSLRTDIADNERTITSLRTDIASNERTITSLRTDITDNERAITSLRRDNEQLNTQISNLNELLDAIGDVQ